MQTETRLDDGLPLEVVAERDWPVNRDAVLKEDGAAQLSAADRAFFRSLRPRSLTAVLLCIDR